MMVYKQCEHCSQWLNEETKHYRITLKNGMVVYIHYIGCLNYYVPNTPMHRIEVIKNGVTVAAQTVDHNLYDDYDYIAERGID